MAIRRVTARNGLSYLDANRQCIVEVSGEVMEIKEEIKRRWPDTIDCWFDKDRLKFVVTVKYNGKEELLYETDHLTWGDLDRIQRAESLSSDDMLDEVDRINAAREKQIDDEFTDAIGDAGERLLHALRKDGVTDHADIYGTKNRRARAINR